MRILLRTLRELLEIFGWCVLFVGGLWLGWCITVVGLILIAITRHSLGIQ
jgi:hypothetical protein